MSFSDREPFPKMQGCNLETIPCRFCRFAPKGRYALAACDKFDDKPDEVYFDSAPCPLFEEGHDNWDDEFANFGRPKP